MNKIIENIFYKTKNLCEISKEVILKEFDTVTSTEKLNKIAWLVINLIKKCNRDDIKHEHFHTFFSTILGVYINLISYSETIKLLYINSFGLNSMANLRAQLEAGIQFLYFVEPNKDLNEIEKRVESYHDWNTVKMFKNYNKSKKFNLLNEVNEKVIKSDEFEKTLMSNYNNLNQKYKNNKKYISDLKKVNSFPESKVKYRLIKKFDIEGFAEHVFAEGSATIHSADFSDRTINLNNGYYRYNIKSEGDFWPLLMSNYLMTNIIVIFSDFLGIKPIIKHKLTDIYNN